MASAISASSAGLVYFGEVDIPKDWPVVLTRIDPQHGTIVLSEDIRLKYQAAESFVADYARLHPAERTLFQQAVRDMNIA